MNIPSENETWLIERGDEIIEKKAAQGYECLSKWERLVYCLWVCDYSIRNAGDLDTGTDIYPNYLPEMRELASEL